MKTTFLMDFSSKKTSSLGTFFMDIFRVLNGLVDFQEGVLKLQMSNIFCIFCLKVKHSWVAWLYSAGAESLHSCTVLRPKEGKNHIKYFSLRALEFEKPQLKNSVLDMNLHISEILKCFTAWNWRAAKERTAQDIFTGGYFMLKVHYQNGSTVVCFKQICTFPDSPTPALTTGRKTKLRPAENGNGCSL